MSPQESFKFGFLLGCTEMGLDTQQSHTLVKQALGGIGNVLGEMIEAPGRIISSIGPHVMNAGLLLGAGLPIAAGGAGGWALAKATEDDSNVDEAKADEVLAEYQRLTDQAKRQVALKRFRGQATVGGLHRPLSPVPANGVAA
jgi:hypothetical protein